MVHPIFRATELLLELFLHPMQFCSVTDRCSRQHMPTGFLAVCRSAEGDQFAEMCYSKMNMRFLLVLLQEEVSVVG